jgi:hypothetical protein
MASDAFDELLCAINPYVDEVLGPDAFHRFSDLPLELRHKVYEQYFANDTRSLACNYWPDHYGMAYIRLYNPKGNKWSKSTPFLPSLCLTDRTFGHEATSLWLGSAVCQIDRKDTAAFILNNPHTSDALGQVRKLDLRITNKHVHGHGRTLNLQSRLYPLSVQGVSEETKRSNKLYSQVLGSFTNLRELHITFVLPFINVKQNSTRPSNGGNKSIIPNRAVNPGEDAMIHKLTGVSLTRAARRPLRSSVKLAFSAWLGRLYNIG